MKIYTVHKPIVSSQDPLDQADELIFVREGFSWFAFLLPLIWLIYQKLWVELVVYFIIVMLFQSLILYFGVGESLSLYFTLFINLIFGFESNNIRRWNLDRADYQMVGSVCGRNQKESEIKFFSHWKHSHNDISLNEQLIPGTPLGTAKFSGFN